MFMVADARRSPGTVRVLLLVLLGAAGIARAAETGGDAGAAMRDQPHPFLLWTRDEAAALRQRIETDPAAKAQYEAMRAYERGPGGKKGGVRHTTLINLFDHLVMGDAAAGETEKKALLRIVGTVPEPLTAAFKEAQKDPVWNRGMPSGADKHMRDERTLDALRYDALYDLLTPEERAGVETAFRAYIDFHLDGHKPWHPDFAYTRAKLLPNMHWPRTIGTHLLALALKDPKAIEGMFASEGGWKWFFDVYLADGRFYMEEFGKKYSNMGTMLMWCEGLERLGLGRFGYGYTGTGGATMRRFCESEFEIGWPQSDLGGMPAIAQVTMGDARGGDLLPGHRIVVGYTPDGKGGNRLYSDAHMNGALPKLLTARWFEIAHRRWPDAGFGWFLARMRTPGEDAYQSTLYWGLPPLRDGDNPPPAVRSFYAPERGFVMLRQEESPAYWTSPRPAVALQLAGYYVHYTHDCLSLLGYHAFNRPIYANRQISNGYGGNCPWTDSVQGHCGVVVDGEQAKPVDDGNSGTPNTRVRHGLGGAVKWVSARASGVYPEVDQERVLVLADEWMLDVSDLRSPRPRRFDWYIHALGEHRPGSDAWQPSTDLAGGRLWEGGRFAERAKDGKYDLVDAAKLTPGADAWSFTALQTNRLADPAKGRLPPAWWERQVGVRVRMLPAEGATTAYAGKTPISVKAKAFAEPEIGGVTLVARREGTATRFAALHEPFERNAPRIASFERLAESGQGLLVAIRGEGIDDRIAVRLGDPAGGPATFTAGDESITVGDTCHLRIAGDRVTVTGDLRALRLRVTGTPKLTIDGTERPAVVRDGMLILE